MYADMLNLAGRWRELALFYNGAKCGASAPDHAHLQAVRRDGIPLLGVIDNATVVLGEPLCNVGDGCIYNVKGYVVPFFMIVSKTVSCSLGLLERLLAVMPLVDNELEPRMNVIACCDRNDGFVTVVLPRAKHRPACYYADDESQRVVSPGALDMSGLMVAPRKCDFENITADEAVALLREVAMSQDEADAVVERLKMQQ
jgi:hypothetical protein